MHRRLRRGYGRHPALGHRWFRQSFAHSEFLALGIGVQLEMQRAISCYEALTQAGLILAAASLVPCSGVPVTLRALLDNSGAESGLRNLLTASRILAYFLERLSLLAAIHRMHLDASHIPWHANAKADMLSRSAAYALPPVWLPHAEICASLQELGLPRPTISVSPPFISAAVTSARSGSAQQPHVKFGGILR